MQCYYTFAQSQPIKYSIMTKMKIDSLIEKYHDKLIKYDSNFFSIYNIKYYIESALDNQKPMIFFIEDRELNDQFDSILIKYGDCCLSDYNKYVILKLIRISIKKIDQYPAMITELFRDRFNKITDEIKKETNLQYNHNSDVFRKDLSICSLNMFPAGAQVVHVSGFGRKFIISGGIKQFFEFLLFYIVKMRGVFPYYQIHTDKRCLHEFNPEGWDKCYIRIAEMLKNRLYIKGLVGTSWFYDPVIVHISPRLSYLRDVPLSNGARFFRVGTSEADVKNATAKSKTRKEFYARGEYSPTAYILIWMREDLISWAESNKNRLLGCKKDD